MIRCIKRGVEHNGHRVQRKQIDSYKVCSKCPLRHEHKHASVLATCQLRHQSATASSMQQMLLQLINVRNSGLVHTLLNERPKYVNSYWCTPRPVCEEDCVNDLSAETEDVICSLFGACVLMTHSLNFLLPVSITRIGYSFTCGIRLLQGVIEVYYHCFCNRL